MGKAHQHEGLNSTWQHVLSSQKYSELTPAPTDLCIQSHTHAHKYTITAAETFVFSLPLSLRFTCV